MSEKKSSAGKGDKWRKTDYKKYYNRYDEINWKSKPIKKNAKSNP